MNTMSESIEENLEEVLEENHKEKLEREKEIIEKALKLFQKSEEAHEDNRQAAIEDIKFARLSEQWSESIKRQRELEGRPCLTINRLPAFIRQVTNDARQNKISIKTHPVDDTADPETAKIINGLIKNIEYTSNADVAYDIALDDAVTRGFGFFRIDIEYAHDDTFDLDIKINPIHDPMTIFPDHTSVAHDSSDWDYCFVVNHLTKEEFEEKYPDAKQTNWDDYTHGRENDWYDGETIRVAEYWERKEIVKTVFLLNDNSIITQEQFEENQEILEASGLQVVNQRDIKSYQVKQYILTSEEILEENDWAGKYIPIIPVYGDTVNVEGKRHLISLIRDVKDSQRNYNYWRTAATELVALAPKAPFIGKKGSFAHDAKKWATANTVTHAYIEYDGDHPPERQPFPGVPAGALQEAMNSSDDLKNIMGLHDASLGRQGNETSGVAIMARQRQGDKSTFHFTDNLSRAITHAGRILIDLIPKVYNNQRVIRILGEDETPENVQINQEFVDDKGDTKLYDLSIGKYDLTVSAGASYQTQRQESATQMLEMMRANPSLMQTVGDLFVKNLDWNGADEIAERLKKLLPPQLQEQNTDVAQMQQQSQQQMQEFQAQVAQEKQKYDEYIQTLQQQVQTLIQENQALKRDKSLDAQKVNIDAFEAETDRLKVQAEMQKNNPFTHLG